MGVVFSAATDVGVSRRVNEDSFFARSPVFLVADGMGGHARGDRASQEAVAVFASRFPTANASADEVLLAVQAANDAVRGLSTERDSGASVAGTTLAGVIRVAAGGGDASHWMVVNIGDSRVYSWDGRTLNQLTVDHSAVQELIDSGEIDREQAASHPDRNVITRALGAADRADIDVWLLPERDRQTFLVCSDGLCKELDDARISAILAADPDEAPGARTMDDGPAGRLVAAAVAAGGHDNVTAIVIESIAENVSDSGDTRDRFGVERVLEDTRPRG